MLGACLGSFFNVCIYRMPLGVPLSYPGSHCYRCGQSVRWYDNLPLLSYWILRGRCRSCGAGFSVRYFLVELLTMTLLLTATFQLGYSLALVPAWIFISLLIIATFTDIDHWIIPDRITLGGLAAGLVLAAVPAIGNAPGNPLRLAPDSMLLGLFDWVPAAYVPLAHAVAGAAGGWALLWGVGFLGTLIFRKEAMGFGDVKLFGMFGAFCGLTGLLPILLIASAVGTVAGVIGMLRARAGGPPPAGPPIAPLQMTAGERHQLLDARPLAPGERRVVAAALECPGVVGRVRHHLPFGPSLAIAAFIVFLWGERLSDWVLNWMLRQSFP